MREHGVLGDHRVSISRSCLKRLAIGELGERWRLRSQDFVLRIGAEEPLT